MAEEEKPGDGQEKAAEGEERLEDYIAQLRPEAKRMAVEMQFDRLLATMKRWAEVWGLDLVNREELRVLRMVADAAMDGKGSLMEATEAYRRLRPTSEEQAIRH